MNSSFKLGFLIGFFLLFISCKAQVAIPNKQIKDIVLVNDTTFVNLKDYSTDFAYDMKYATEDNFLKAKVYDCAECFLRMKTVNAIIEANKLFMDQGYRIKFFDCYRPLDIQKKMWQIVSNPKYVADPSKGSIHNRGGAVDITLVDKRSGKELEMGTPFDFFGEEASHGYSNLSKKVINNRKLLKRVMVKANFNSFDSEWWHYNLKSALNDKVSNVKWSCVE
ncbi:M15 family metallopeptidase [Flavobacterium sp. WC2421]|jgi:zinc D-Ala-D-Ala dipeptidase|uniref:D-alanyl-D-alanine dipeptidase n=3 Tax=unclassified Flavobacterium TaxID=196869 RepID=A0AB39W856_9FLAO